LYDIIDYMNSDIFVRVNAPSSIVVKCIKDEDMQELILHAETTKNPVARFLEIDFSRNNAIFLRKFLTGKKVEFHLGVKDRAILKFLADEGDDAFFWNGNLMELAKHKKPRSRKTYLDLINYFPYRYIDRSKPQAIKDLILNEEATVVGKVVNKNYNARFDLLTVTVEDSMGQRIRGAFFNQKWLEWTYKVEDEVILTGKYTEYHDKSKNKYYPQISSPRIDKVISKRGAVKIIPVYSERNKIGKTWETMATIETILEKTPWINDPLPESLIKESNLLSREAAYRKIHFPDSIEDLERAKERIAYEELLQLQTYLHMRNAEWSHQVGSVKNDHSLGHELIKKLPYSLTGAQNRAIALVQKRMTQIEPMHMMLQGDVSSGKTTILEFAALASVSSGYQSAVVAPTDILATQLFERLTEDSANLEKKIVVEYLGGKTKKKADIYKRLKAGQIDIIVGTHAILQPSVVFNNLGTVIIDEQHKFGTQQRTHLTSAGKDGTTPDLLIMSATPIPRTMASVIYGDMDIAILDELPAGRLPIETIWSLEADEAWEKIREQVSLGHQAYVVTSLVEESETIDAKSAEETYDMLQSRLPGVSMGIMHGKLKADEKSAVMDDFLNNNISVLVATTVIEVGVNVPNATVIAILNAERFGLASLHQIRGRVGRSALQSTCYLIGEPNSIEGEERLQALVASNDGFYIAEKDLEIRGEGKLFGVKQSGEGDLRLANIFDHKDLIEKAKRDVALVKDNKEFIAEVKKIYHEKSIDS
jgi:ATP-dependent DNA helicase RecG